MRKLYLQITHGLTEIVQAGAAMRELADMIPTSSLQIEIRKMATSIEDEANQIISLLENEEEKNFRR